MRRKRTRRIRYRPGNRPGARRLTVRELLRQRLSAAVPGPRRTRTGAPAPRRRGRWRVFNRRRFMAAQAVLALVLVAALGGAASVIARSIRTARLNRQLAAMYGVSGSELQVQIAAPPVDDGSEPAFAAIATPTTSSPYGELSAMVLPDGTPIDVPEPVPLPEQVAEAAVFHRTDLDILPKMRKLTQENPDTVGWLNIPHVVHLPIVYRNNTCYLDHDFTGAENASGTLFLDENSPVNSDTQNLLIHGHNMYDGSMFGTLTHYRWQDFLHQHPLITFSTLWEKESYAVFAVMLVSSKTDDPRYFNYFSSPTFASAADFNAYIAEVEARSMYESPLDVRPDDALLTLSTCYKDDRLVLLARRLRPGEAREAVISAVEASYKS